jgi:hypothetical protein
MKLHIFNSTKESDVIGFTADITAANLPAEFGPWTRSTEAIQTEMGSVGIAGIGTSDSVVAAVERDGFYIGRGTVKVTRVGSI